VEKNAVWEQGRERIKIASKVAMYALGVARDTLYSEKGWWE
jgi:hypothetical protein